MHEDETRPDWAEMMDGMQQVRLFAGLLVRRGGKGGLSAQETDLLYRLAMSDGELTAGELCQGILADKSVVSRLVERLAVRGLLERAHSVGDRRRVPLRITERGREELNATCAYYLEPIYALRRAVGTEDFDRLMDRVAQANSCMMAKEEVRI